jgi:hypothetical protein
MTDMTRDDVIRLAREAHMHHMAWDDDYIEGTERFAALVAAAEREACAKVCEDGPLPKESTTFTHIPTLVGCAAAIRARGESK